MHSLAPLSPRGRGEGSEGGHSWKRDGRTLASAGADNVIKVWDFVTGERKKTIEGFGKEVTSISFIGITDQTLASSGDDQIQTVSDNGEKIRSFAGGANFMNAASITPDGRIVIAGSMLLSSDHNFPHAFVARLGCGARPSRSVVR